MASNKKLFGYVILIPIVLSALALVGAFLTKLATVAGGWLI